VNDRSLSEHDYDDVVGVRYEFPSRYRSLVAAGEHFVYYRGRRRSDGTSTPQVYLGAGVIGAIHQSESTAGRWVCEIEHWQPFVEPVYFKDSNGMHYESGGVQGGLYWRQGVRLLSDEEYERIMRAAEAREHSS
jgi:hypothetical protein